MLEGVYETATGDLLRWGYTALTAGPGETRTTSLPAAPKARYQLLETQMSRWDASAQPPAWTEVPQPSPDAVVTKTADYFVEPPVTHVRCDASSAAFTVTLPPAADFPGRELHFKREDGSANVVTLAASNGDSIEVDELDGQGQVWSLFSNGVDGWEVE